MLKGVWLICKRCYYS